VGDAGTGIMASPARAEPEPTAGSAAFRDQERRNVELRSAMLREFGALSPAAVAGLVGSRAARPGSIVAGWRRAQRLVTIRRDGETVVPRFLLLDDGHPDPVARGALRTLAAQGFSNSQAALWWTVPASALDGRRPVDLLRDARQLPAEQRTSVADALAAAARRFRSWF
jgi:hypothetical protein